MTKKYKLILGIIGFVIIVLGVVYVILASTKITESFPIDPYCQIDADCVPTPGECHPTTCVNTDNAAAIINNNKDIGNTACTFEFRMNAAYSPEDCICEVHENTPNICVNKNLNRTTID